MINSNSHKAEIKNQMTLSLEQKKDDKDSTQVIYYELEKIAKRRNNSECFNHLGKTVQFVDQRICHKFEQAISPTVVAKDKKAYAVFTPFDFNRAKYREAVSQIKIN